MEIIGMLYIVEIRMVKKSTNEKIKQKLLMVGCERRDIARKMKWIIDGSKYDEVSITNVEKVRQKIHLLQTVVTQVNEPTGPVIQQGESSKVVSQSSLSGNDYKPNLYAVGITTTMLAKDEDHAMRKTGHAIIASVSDITSRTGASLSGDSKVLIEQIPMKSRTASARDVSHEINTASFVRG